MIIRTILLALALVCHCARLTRAGNTYTWTGDAPAPANQSWSDPRNWTPSGGPPTTGDTAVINSPGVGTININAPVTVANFSAIRTILRGGASLTVSDTLETQGSDLGPSGGITTTGSGTFIVDAGIATTLSSSLTINGSATIQSGGNLIIASKSTVINNRYFTLADGATLTLMTPNALFVNNSSFTAGNSICYANSSLFSNAPSGYVYASANKTLQLQGNIANSGEFQPQTGALINVSTGAALHDKSSFTGPGTNLLSGVNTLDGQVRVPGNLQFNGNTIILNGTLEVAANASFVWLAGTLSGIDTNVTGSILVDAGGYMELNSQNGLNLRNMVLTNGGTTAWTYSGTVFMGFDARIDNNAIFNINGDGTIAPLPNGTGDFNKASFNNFGLLSKQYGKTNSGTTINVPLYNSGKIYEVTEVMQGNLFLGAGGIPGALKVESNATLHVTGGNFIATSQDYIFASPGTVFLDTGASLYLPPAAIFAVRGNFVQNGGTISGDRATFISVFGSYTWNGGMIALTNPAAILVLGGGHFNIEGGAGSKLMQQGRISNFGTINWTNDSSSVGVYFGDGVVLENSGMINCQCDAGITDVSTNIHPVLTNTPTGVITKTANTGTTFLGLLVVNYGSIQPDKGTIEMVIGYNDLGSSTPPPEEITLGGGNVKFDRPVDLNGSVSGFGGLSGTITNKGSIQDDSRIKYAGVLANLHLLRLGDAPGAFVYSGGGTFSQSTSGRLILPIRGTNAAAVDFGQLQLDPSYGSVALAGTLEAEVTEGYAPPIGATFHFLSSAARSGTFDHVYLPPGFMLNSLSSGLNW